MRNITILTFALTLESTFLFQSRNLSSPDLWLFTKVSLDLLHHSYKHLFVIPNQKEPIDCCFKRQAKCCVCAVVQAEKKSTEHIAVISNNFLHFAFSYSAHLSLPASPWLCVLYSFTHHSLTFHWVHFCSRGPIHWKIRGNKVSSAQFEALLWRWMWNRCGAPLTSKIRALSLKALYLCSLDGSGLSLNRFGVTLKSQLLLALTVNGHKGWRRKRNISAIVIRLWADHMTKCKVKHKRNKPKWPSIYKSKAKSFNFNLCLNSVGETLK